MNQTTDQLFSSYPDSSKVWIFSSSTKLTNEQEEQIAREVQDFLVSWKAHGDPLQASCKLLHGHFLIVSADEAAIKASGCSIDGLFRTVKRIGEKLSCDLSIGSDIYFLDGLEVASMKADEFEREIKQGRVTEATTVFNNAVQTLGDIRAGAWQTAFKNSWHAKRFPLD